MKKMMMGLIGVIFLIHLTGCDEAVSDLLHETEQSFAVVNSAYSTFRIVKVEANKVGLPLQQLNISDDGLHRGESDSFSVEDNECGVEWKVVVYYNDSDHTHCEAVKIVPCNDDPELFVFNNTEC